MEAIGHALGKLHLLPDTAGHNQALSAAGHDVQEPDTWWQARMIERVEYIDAGDGRTLAFNSGGLLLTFVRPDIAYAP